MVDGASPYGDVALFSVSSQRLFDALRSLASGGDIEADEWHLLGRVGLVKDEVLSDSGRALFKLRWVMRDEVNAARALGDALRQLMPLQVIEQELRGLGPVTEDGVLDLLKLHRAVPTTMTVDELRPTFRWLNSAGILVYSQKTKSVRTLAPAPHAALAGEVQAIAGMVSPRTPFLNIVRLRRILRPLRGVVWWADAHFGARALEELAQELDLTVVTEVRILSGDADSVLTERSLKDFARFRAEMAEHGISAEWRVDRRGVRDWHDRFIADASMAWNVPPINTLLKNDYSEIAPASERPPLDDWWARSATRS